MNRLLRARLGVARITIDGTPEGMKAGVSRVQAKAVKELAAKDPDLQSVSAEDLAKLHDLAASVSWAEGDLALVMSCLTPPLPESRGKKSRRPLQHFSPSFLNYFTASEWALLQAPISYGEKADVCMRRILELGGRNLDEPAMKMMNSLLLLLSDPNAARMQASQKRVYLDTLKKTFKARVRVAPAPPHYITMLPPAPSDVAKSHPKLYAAAFPIVGGQESKPTPCAIALSALNAVDNSYGCRIGSSANFGAIMPAAQQPTCPTQALLHQLIAMQAHFMGGGSGGVLQLGDQGRQPTLRAMSNLLGGRPPAPQTLLQLPGGREGQDDAEPSARQVAVAEEVARAGALPSHSLAAVSGGSDLPLAAAGEPQRRKLDLAGGAAFDGQQLAASSSQTDAGSDRRDSKMDGGMQLAIHAGDSLGGSITPQMIGGELAGAAAGASPMLQLLSEERDLEHVGSEIVAVEVPENEDESGGGALVAAEVKEDAQGDSSSGDDSAWKNFRLSATGSHAAEKPGAAAASSSAATSVVAAGSLAQALLSDYKRRDTAKRQRATPQRGDSSSPAGVATPPVAKKPAAAPAMAREGGRAKPQAADAKSKKQRSNADAPRPSIAQSSGSDARPKAAPVQADGNAKKASKKNHKPASMSHEGTRLQYLVRTGDPTRGKGSIAFKYVAGDVASKKKAQEDASKLVKALRG